MKLFIITLFFISTLSLTISTSNASELNQLESDLNQRIINTDSLKAQLNKIDSLIKLLKDFNKTSLDKLLEEVTRYSDELTKSFNNISTYITMDKFNLLDAYLKTTPFNENELIIYSLHQLKEIMELITEEQKIQTLNKVRKIFETVDNIDLQIECTNYFSELLIEISDLKNKISDEQDFNDSEAKSLKNKIDGLKYLEKYKFNYSKNYKDVVIQRFDSYDPSGYTIPSAETRSMTETFKPISFIKENNFFIYKFEVDRENYSAHNIQWKIDDELKDSIKACGEVSGTFSDNSVSQLNMNYPEHFAGDSVDYFKDFLIKKLQKK